MRKHTLLIFIIAIEIVMWVIFIGFALFFYKGHQQYPDDWIPIFGIAAMLGMGGLFSFFMLSAWQLFQKNQKEFDESRLPQELGLPHSVFDFSVPLSLQGDLLKIHRGLRIQTVPLREICWIHHRQGHNKRSGCYLHLYLKSGKHILAVFDRRNIAGVYAIIEKIPSLQPGILISEGYHSPGYKECKKAYKSILKR